VIQAFRMERRQEERFREMNQNLMDRNLDQARALGRLMPLVRATGGLGSLVILYFGGTQVMRGQITYGDFVAFFAYLGLLLRPTITLGWMLSLIQRARVGLERLDEILSTVPTIANAPGAVFPPEVRGAIEFRGLTFRYGALDEPSEETVSGEDPQKLREMGRLNGLRELEAAPASSGTSEGRAERPATCYGRLGQDGRPYALLDVSLSLAPGEQIAIIGPVGSGKSTLLKAIPRLIEVPEGKVYLDGHDLTRTPLDRLRRSVGYVPQDDFLFSVSIAENIAFGRPAASPVEIEAAARLAALHETILSFPDGYATVVGERGLTLSGGQRQRIALARALMIQPEVLVLDNALAHVDTETEREILDALRDRPGLHTLLMATNRLGRLGLADRIVVLEAGRVEAIGTHAELMARSRTYREMYEHQRLSEELADL
jgi:ATP-binding cassette subfamily B multidrug efflux pump